MQSSASVSSRQIRAARALLDWSQEELAEASGLSIATIRKLESGHISPRASTTFIVRNAVEFAGLEFIEPDGVCRRDEDITILSNPDSIASFIEDIRLTVRNKKSEVLFVSTPEAPIFSCGINDQCGKYDDIFALANDVSVKCLFLDNFDNVPAAHNIEFRSLSKCFMESMPFYVYGDKHAYIVPRERTSPKIIIVRSMLAAEAAKRQFYSMWDKATPLQGLYKLANTVVKLSDHR